MLFLLSCLMFFRAAQAAPELPAEYRPQEIPVEAPLVLPYRFPSGDRAELRVINYPKGHSDLFFFHMHMPEATSKKACEDLVRANGGTFMYLVHAGGERDITVKVGKTRYSFDPNRIFTAKGLAERTEPKPNAADLVELQKFVDWILRNLRLGMAQRARPMVTAVHNNTDDDAHGELLSILTEKKILRIDNELVNQNRNWDIDNFFIATQRGTYDALVAGYNPNISLRMAKPRDIGYLSNWMIREGIEYLNVETQVGNDADNRAMIDMIQRSFH